MDNKFNDYEYHMIEKFTTMCYSRKCNFVDRIKMRSKTSVWHELLTYLLSPDSIIKTYKFESNTGENNNCVTTDLQINYMVRPYVLFQCYFTMFPCSIRNHLCGLSKYCYSYVEL